MRPSLPGGPRLRELVLVGGGHAHLEVLRRLARRPLPGVRASAVLERPETFYSGMVPGLVAGQYRPEALAIDVAALARRAGARVLAARAVRVDPVARRIELEDGTHAGYDVASLDVGSVASGLELPGVRAHALAVRPVGGFVAALEARLAALPGRLDARRPALAVVGTGAAGVELAFVLRARGAVQLIGAARELLPGYAPRVRARVAALTRDCGIALHCGRRVVALEPGALELEDGVRLPADLVLWATGAAAPALARASPLARDAGGFVRVRATLEVEAARGLFAAGDCAALEGFPALARAGVHAVRQGPVLDANLRAWLAGRPLRAFRPQRDALALLNLGAGRALGTKWGRVVTGRAPWWLKDRIDRRFVARYRA